jgi:hypothetical protein
MPFRWLFDEGQAPEACLDKLAYADWLKFVFDHPSVAKGEDRWYCQDDAGGFYFKDSRQFLGHLTRLLNEPEFLLADYSLEQIKQGFWCFVSAFELPDILEDKEIEFGLRRACIAAFEPAYRRLFNRRGLEKLAFMYWDALAYTFYSAQGRAESDDHRRVQEAMFETLIKILNHKERVNFISALHGLGHLRHEGSAEAIMDSLYRRGDLRQGDMSYAMACVRGDMDSLPCPPLA